MLCKQEFGFYPRQLLIDAGPVTVRSLPELERTASDVLARDAIEDDWIFAPPRQAVDILTGMVRSSPHPARVFALPRTHWMEHAECEGEDHLEFLLWALSFFVGMRLTASEAGFLDSTPVKPGKLVDFILPPRRLTRNDSRSLRAYEQVDLTSHSEHLTSAVDLAERFWQNSGSAGGRHFAAAAHALFIGQNPLHLEFERFLYLYVAIDACYRLTRLLHPTKGRPRPGGRIKWMCEHLGVTLPMWADPAQAGHHRKGPEVTAVRNAALHEGLFMGAPLGFGPLKNGLTKNITLEMRALACRLLVALIGGRHADYVRTPVDTRGTFRLDLNQAGTESRSKN